MEHKLNYLPSASVDILEIEAYLYEFSPTAAYNFTYEIENKASTLVEHPYMYQVYEDDDYFRSMPLCYSYRLFYHVEEETKTIQIHRVLYGMRDIKNIIQSTSLES